MTTYITDQGARRLADELERLASKVRPQLVAEVAAAAAQGDRSENAEYIYGKKRLREVDRRLQFITRRLDSLTVVYARELPADRSRVFFGAYVGVSFDGEAPRRYRLVGPDEIDPDIGAVSYLAPLGRALMGRRLRDVVVLQRPAGEVEVEIVAIEYTEPDPDPSGPSTLHE